MSYRLLVLLCFAFFIASCLVGCRLHPLAYSSYSETFLKKDNEGDFAITTVSIEASCYHLQIDSIYGRKRMAWIEGRIFSEGAPAKAICIYATKRSGNKFKPASRLGCSDESGLVKFKTKIYAATSQFLLSPKPGDTLPPVLYQLTEVKTSHYRIGNVN